MLERTAYGLPALISVLAILCQSTLEAAGKPLNPIVRFVLFPAKPRGLVLGRRLYQRGPKIALRCCSPAMRIGERKDRC